MLDNTSAAAMRNELAVTCTTYKLTTVRSCALPKVILNVQSENSAKNTVRSSEDWFLPDASSGQVILRRQG